MVVTIKGSKGISRVFHALPLKQRQVTSCHLSLLLARRVKEPRVTGDAVGHGLKSRIVNSVC